MANDLFTEVAEEEVDISGGIFGAETEAPSETIYQEDEAGKPPPNRWTGPRQSGEQLLGTGIAAIGGILVNRNVDPPVGRALILEAPLAGRKIDEAIAGSWLDRILQPIFRKSDELEGLGAVIALPVLVGLYERRPELAPMLEPLLIEIVGTTLENVAPIMRKKASTTRRSAKSVNDIGEAFNMEMPRGADPAAIFAGWIFNGGEENSEEPA